MVSCVQLPAYMDRIFIELTTGLISWRSSYSTDEKSALPDPVCNLAPPSPRIFTGFSVILPLQLTAEGTFMKLYLPYQRVPNPDAGAPGSSYRVQAVNTRAPYICLASELVFHDCIRILFKIAHFEKAVQLASVSSVHMQEFTILWCGLH